LEKFWTFLVEYQNVLESSRGLHGGAHMPQRVHMDQRVLPTWAWSSMPTCPTRPRAKPYGFLMGQGKGNLGGKFSPWGHRVDLEAKAAPLADPLDLFKGEGRAGACSSSNPSRRPNCCPPHLSLSRLHVGEALLQKFSTISTTPSCC
jgi:hypothetical protein